MQGSVERKISDKARQQFEAGINKVVLSKTQGQAGLDHLLNAPMDLTIAYDYPNEES